MKSPISVYVDESAVGVGKTYSALQDIIRVPGRYILCAERIESIAELQSDLYRLGAGASDLRIITITNKERLPRSSVQHQIESLPQLYQTGHVLVLCTHTAIVSAVT